MREGDRTIVSGHKEPVSEDTHKVMEEALSRAGVQRIILCHEAGLIIPSLQESMSQLTRHGAHTHTLTGRTM